jgi:hypothetical protein
LKSMLFLQLYICMLYDYHFVVVISWCSLHSVIQKFWTWNHSVIENNTSAFRAFIYLCLQIFVWRFSVIQYKGPSLSVACIQEFQGDLYVCYNGSELRRFDLQVRTLQVLLFCLL